MVVVLSPFFTVSLAIVMNKILVFGPASNDMLETLRNSDLEVHEASDLDSHLNIDEWLQEHGESVRYVLTNGHDGLPGSYLSYLPNLKLISCNGVGYDGIDVDAAVRNNIVVTHTANVAELNAETSTTAILLMLACYRSFRSCENHARSGSWERKSHALTRTADYRKVGILGMGRIGRAIGEKAMAFGASVSYHCRTRKEDLPWRYYDSLLEMARDVDCLICIVPGGPDTKHIVNAEVMNALGPDGVLINVARGSVVDEQELILALQGGRLGSAGLDVFENEPHIPEALRALENVVLLPHVGTATVETRAAMGALTVENILSHAKDGSVLTPVPECLSLL
ncbi:D-isomer specific 2-hydroxyacid dehydrogenase [Fragilaria crotonensis]|nr:D-isomer specific 2-hydroxyacid dehydrogenase [Fragilaria crotonensis]